MCWRLFECDVMVVVAVVVEIVCAAAAAHSGEQIYWGLSVDSDKICASTCLISREKSNYKINRLKLQHQLIEHNLKYCMLSPFLSGYWPFFLRNFPACLDIAPGRQRAGYQFTSLSSSSVTSPSLGW